MRLKDIEKDTNTRSYYMAGQPTPQSKFATKGKLKEAAPDATIVNPENSGLRFIPVLLGAEGKYEGDLPIKLEKIWPRVRTEYRSWFASQSKFKLGEIQSVMLGSDIWAIYMLCLNKNGKVDQPALTACLKKLVELSVYEHASIHLSTETTSQLKKADKLIEQNFIDNGINTYLYK